jgi:nitroimidazol reductase NimA-like FMN-containing flavoprotein (pyridoxamine 5'-phosphate oxidase superfamily)
MHVLNDPLAQELLHSALLARLGYNGTDGPPRVIPIGYHWNGGQFVICTAEQAPKVRALRLNRRSNGRPSKPKRAPCTSAWPG